MMVMISHTVYSLERNGVSGGMLYFLHTTIGQFGVSIFIIISGFLAANALASANITKFYINRATGLLPPIWVAFVFSGCLALIFKHVLGLTTYSNFFKLITDNPINIRHLLVTIAGLDGYLWVSKIALKGYLIVGEWFIGFVIILLIVAPFCNFLVRRFGILALGGAFILSVLSYYSSQVEGPFSWIAPTTNRAMNPATRIFEFMFGMYLFSSYSRDRLRPYFVGASMLYVFTLAAIYTYSGRNMMTLGFSSYIFATATVVIYYELSRSFYSHSVNTAITSLANLSFVAILIHRRFMNTVVSTMPIKALNEIGYIALFGIIIFCSFKTAQWITPISKFITKLLKSMFYKLFFLERKKNDSRNEALA